jgi:hypothetical protein
MSQWVEFRSYNLKPGSRDEFHQLFLEQALPMLERWRVDVVSYGPSAHDENSYFLFRSYPGLEAREQSQRAFYGSAEWRDGPRVAIVGLIESYTSVVVELDDPTVDGLRRTSPGRARKAKR